jgi:hypothetical protein
MQNPLPSGSYKISISNSGFVNQTFQGNTIDTQGGENAPQPAVDLVLAGNTFGARILSNHFLGGGFRLEASPTNDPSSPPYIWGWSHAPFLGALIQGNTFEDTVPGFIGVDHSAAIATSRGRTYLSATIAGNVFQWSTAPVNPNLGQPGYTTTAYPWIDPNELRLTIPTTGNINVGQGPAGSTASVAFQVSAALVNGTSESNQQIVLQSTSPNPAFLDDSQLGKGFSEAGPWTQWTIQGEGYSNTHSTAPGGDGSAYATWTFTNLTPGFYEVWATWIQAPNRATNSPFSLYDNFTLLATAAVNQILAPSGYYDQGFSWYSLGESYAISSGTLVVKLTNAVAAGSYVVADAIRVNRLGGLP